MIYYTVGQYAFNISHYLKYMKI